MELTLLQALGWRLDCITTYSFVELLISNLDSMDSHVLDELSTRVTKVLFGYMIGIKDHIFTLLHLNYSCLLDGIFALFAEQVD